MKLAITKLLLFYLFICYFQGVCMSIRQPVTKQWLLEVCEKYRWGIDKGRAKKHSLEEPHGSMLPPSKAPRHTVTQA